MRLRRMLAFMYVWLRIVEVSPAVTPDISILRPGNRYVPLVHDAYVDQVQPVLSKRCVGCHSCTNGPCQLNLTSYAGLARGLSTVNPYVLCLVRETTDAHQ